MFIHSNIRYLRKLKKISQEEFGVKLGLNRGNIASYEQSTQPPLDVLMKLSDWFNISLDALLKEDLSESLTFQASEIDHKISEKEIAQRLKEVSEFLGISIPDFAKSLGMSKANFLLLLEKKKGVDFPLLLRISKRYPWISFDWLLKGNGNMAGANIPPQKGLSKVAESKDGRYGKENEFSQLFGKFMGQVLDRLDKLEQKK